KKNNKKHRKNGLLTNENTQFESHNKHIINNKKSPSNIIQKYKNTPITKHGRKNHGSLAAANRGVAEYELSE
ncbi:hypothetical protein ACPFU7_004147, partial [Shigella sonnei]|nr:hypothetical protein [Shigella sonnei]EGM8258235.1 hypothetical protein [Shigella sonnei]HBD6733242.1 hypothetical protein [Shigella sonnei]HCY3562017.1 hypothetical protein [Shigella sonnei]